MSQGCSILVVMVWSYQEEICRREANSSPNLTRETDTPRERQGKDKGSVAPTLKTIKLPNQTCAFPTARSPRDIDISGAGLLPTLLIAPYDPA